MCGNPHNRVMCKYIYFGSMGCSLDEGPARRDDGAEQRPRMSVTGDEGIEVGATMTEEPVRWSVPRSPEHLGEIVAARRRDLGLTQAEVALRAGVTRRFVNELENSHSTMYARRLFATIDALGYRIELQPRGASDGDAPDGTGRPDDASVRAVKDLGW